MVGVQQAKRGEWIKVSSKRQHKLDQKEPSESLDFIERTVGRQGSIMYGLYYVKMYSDHRVKDESEGCQNRSRENNLGGSCGSPGERWGGLARGGSCGHKEKWTDQKSFFQDFGSMIVQRSYISIISNRKIIQEARTFYFHCLRFHNGMYSYIVRGQERHS